MNMVGCGSISETWSTSIAKEVWLGLIRWGLVKSGLDVFPGGKFGSGANVAAEHVSGLGVIPK